MKNFLKYTLATITGLILVGLLSIIILGGIFSAMVASTKKQVVIKENSMLQLKLDEAILDRAPNDPFQDLEIPGFSQTKKTGLDAIIQAIEKSKDEDNIKGIFLRLTNINAGYSACEEIRNALVDFKTSGKFIYAYSETYTQKAYFLATVADKVFINPEGMLMFSGISADAIFFKNALDKLGVEMQVIRHGKFKAAVEPFMLDKMSPENREQVESYIGSIWSNVLAKVSASRGIPVERLNEIADENMLFRPAKDVLAYGLVDSLLYEDQLLDLLRLETGTKPNDGIPVATVSDLKSVPAKRKTQGLAKDKLAVIYASGEIAVDGPSSYGSEMINSADLAREIRLARNDSTIKAIVLRINSPGGSALGSDMILREVKLAAEQKPMVVSMGNLAASGGYYIACAADTIVANPTTLTGSIGVFGLIPNLQNLLEKKLGINSDVVKTNKLSDMPSTTRPLTTVEKAQLQNMVENVYSTFVNHVAEGRGMTFEAVDAIGEGRVWTGEIAQKIGLVDVLGDLKDAIRIASEMASLENYRIVDLPKQKDPIEELLKGFGGNVKMRVLENELGESAKYFKTIDQLRKSSGVMARMPYEIILN